MNATTRTLIFVAVATVSALVAGSAWYGSKPGDLEGFSEVGEAIFPKFDDPLKATALTVTDFEKSTNEVQQFAVKQNDDQLWVIPSHHNYPAEADERLARTAASLIGVKKVAVQSRSKDDWKSFGVAAPDTQTATADERGTRITLRDASGNALVDLIVGQKVPNRDGYYYVREPEKSTTYVAKLSIDLSAKFSDWIEPDLLKVNSGDFVEITVDKYSIDEQRGVIVPGEKLDFAKEDLKSTGKWTLSDLQPDEELVLSPITAIANNLDQLKIVGVRPKPEGLSDDMRVNPVLRQMLEAEMQRQGFFIAADRQGNERLYSNEGELIAGVSSGVQYTLYFGEIARGSGKDIEIGLTAETDAEEKSADSKEENSAEDPSADDATAGADSDDESGPRRYLLIKAEFNEKLLGEKPQAPVMPDRPAILDEPAGDAPSDADAEPAADAPRETGDAPGNDADAEDEATENSGDDVPESATQDDACNPFTDPQDDETQQEAAEDAKDEAADAPAGDDTDSPDTAADEPDSTDETQPSADDEKSPESDEQPEGDDPAPTTQDDAQPSTETTPDPVPSADEQPAAPDAEPAVAAPVVDPKQAAQEAYDKAMAEYQGAQAAYERDLKSFEKKIEDGKKKADELSRRFSGWYYVITADSFEKFRVTRTDVVSKKVAEEAKDGE
ncbi:MAG: DUF4340 domain-containing protein [Planctomycetaceae bacterium]